MVARPAPQKKRCGGGTVPMMLIAAEAQKLQVDAANNKEGEASAFYEIEPQHRSILQSVRRFRVGTVRLCVRMGCVAEVLHRERVA